MMLSEMLTALGDRLDYEDTLPTAISRRLTGFINSTQRDILRRKGMSSLRRRVLSFSSVASSPYATMPISMTQILLMVDRTNNRRIIPKDLTWIWERDPGLTLSGPPDVFAVLDYAGAVNVQPAAGGTSLYATSTSGADTTQAVYVEGIDSSGILRQAGPVTLTGVTAVNLAAAITDWVTVNRWWITAPAVGTVTLQSSPFVPLAKLSPGSLYPRYTQVQLNPTPTAASTFYAYGLIEVPNLSIASDQSVIPTDFVDILIEGALEREYLKREKVALAGTCRNTKERLIAELRSYLQSPQAAKGENANGFSALGPFYPAGT
jgi:hypothetical protein